MKTLFIIYIALVVLAVSSCQKAQNQQAAVPTIDTQCVSNPALCQSQVYNTPGYYPYPYGAGYNSGYNSGYNPGYTSGYSSYPNSGYNSYPYGAGYTSGYAGGAFYWTNNSAYLCNCPVGYVPTYNDYGGLGCVQSSQITGGGFGAYAYFSWGANNNQWTNIPQISNTQGYSNTSCYNGVVQSCLVDQGNTCAIGYTCRANSASTRIGLCVSNNAGYNGAYGPVVR